MGGGIIIFWTNNQDAPEHLVWGEGQETCRVRAKAKGYSSTSRERGGEVYHPQGSGSKERTKSREGRLLGPSRQRGQRSRSGAGHSVGRVRVLWSYSGCGTRTCPRSRVWVMGGAHCSLDPSGGLNGAVRGVSHPQQLGVDTHSPSWEGPRNYRAIGTSSPCLSLGVP